MADWPRTCDYCGTRPALVEWIAKAADGYAVGRLCCVDDDCTDAMRAESRAAGDQTAPRVLRRWLDDQTPTEVD